MSLFLHIINVVCDVTYKMCYVTTLRKVCYKRSSPEVAHVTDGCNIESFSNVAACSVNNYQLAPVYRGLHCNKLHKQCKDTVTMGRIHATIAALEIQYGVLWVFVALVMQHVIRMRSQNKRSEEIRKRIQAGNRCYYANKKTIVEQTVKL